jgi:DNA relaxase NicK
MSNLFEISADILAIVEQEEEVPQTTEALELALNSLQIEFQDKALGIAHYVLNECIDINAAEEEVDRLRKVILSKEKKIEWLKAYLKTQMEIIGKDKIQTPLRKIAIQNNPPSLIIDDESTIPDRYKKATIEVDDISKLAEIQSLYPNAKITIEVMKTPIKENIKNGIGVVGTHIETKTRLVIK